MNADVLSPTDPGYPALLREIADPPVLWARGSVEDGDSLAVAIVGSRHATAYGLEVAGMLARDLALRGVTVVSGLARGIDGAAHRGALAADGRTLAVLGNGVDVVYPPEHRDLYREVAARGALLSQFPPGTAPLPRHFPARNRLIAGLALGVVVVEASSRSGALITAGFAADLGREVFAVPGRITAATSEGPNRLVQEGAKLVRNWMDIVQELPEPARRAIGATLAPAPSTPPTDQSDEGRVLAALDDEPQHIEEVIARGGLDAARVAASLVALELAGWARQLEGQRWVAVGAAARRT